MVNVLVSSVVSNNNNICLLGSYSFIDPKYKVRRVEYVADKNGFHPSLINYDDTLKQPVDSEAVKLAKEKHLQLYKKLAEANAQDIQINIPKVINFYKNIIYIMYLSKKCP